MTFEKWMRIDYREERKWKIVLAFNLVTAVLEWHSAGSTEERVRRGISVLWKPPQTADLDDNLADSPEDRADSDQLPQLKKSGSLAALDYGSDDEDEDEELDKDPDAIDLLEPSATVQDALDSVILDGEQPSNSDVQVESVEPKKEDVDDSSALRSVGLEDSHNPMDVSRDQKEEDVLKAEESSAESVIGLKPTSTDPVLWSDPPHMTGSGEPSTSGPKSASKSKLLYAPLRERIAYSDERKLFLHLDDLDMANDTSTEQSVIETLPPPADLSAIFPDLPLLGLLDVAPLPVPNTSDGKKKSDKRSEKDDPNRRVDETIYTKLTPFGQFMYNKPTLVGPLQPARRWRDGQWCNLDESAVTPENDSASAKTAEEVLCSNYSFYQSGGVFIDPWPKIALFDGPKPAVPQPPPPGQPRKRLEHFWSERDDLILKEAVEKYPSNWLLICDIFHSSRVTISTDRRTPWDCYERWKLRWEPGEQVRLWIIAQSLPLLIYKR
jgi:chromatin modification-related protein VID21